MNLEKEYQNFAEACSQIAKDIRESQGIDKGKAEYFNKNSQPIEIDARRLLVLT